MPSRGLRPVFALVQKLTLTPSQTTQADIDRVLIAGWEQQAVEDAIAVCSLLNLMNLAWLMVSA